MKALNANVSILALTDHDTIEGLMPLHEAAENSTIKIINGIELSVRWKKYDIHILGLHIDADDPSLHRLIACQNEKRMARAKEIGSGLANCGVDDAFDKACALAGHERVSRAHYAHLLVNEGKVQDIKQAFKRYLAVGRPAFVPTAWVSIDEAVQVIHQAQGQAVIAHPLKYGLTRSKLYELIRDFKQVGGDGMEVVSGEMTTMDMNELAGLCLRFDLLASTGSDYHHDGVSRTPLGQQRPLPVNCIPIWRQWNI